MTVTQVPDRSVQQREESLRKANDHRLKRAELKRQIHDGEVEIRDVILTPPAFAKTMRVEVALKAMARVGRAKVEKWMWRAGISLCKTLGGLTLRQRHSLLGVMYPTTPAPPPRRVPFPDRVVAALEMLGGRSDSEQLSSLLGLSREQVTGAVSSERSWARAAGREPRIRLLGRGSYELAESDEQIARAA